jgi:hypothetical protein
VAADDELLARLRRHLAGEPGIEEKRMFGGVSFLAGGHMLCGVTGETLVVRVGPAAYEEALGLPHARECDFTGRPLRGLVMVDPRGFAEPAALARWVARGLGFVRTLPPKS